MPAVLLCSGREVVFRAFQAARGLHQCDVPYDLPMQRGAGAGQTPSRDKDRALLARLQSASLGKDTEEYGNNQMWCEQRREQHRAN